MCELFLKLPSSVNSTKAKRRTELGSPHIRQSTTFVPKKQEEVNQKHNPPSATRKMKVSRMRESKASYLSTVNKNPRKLLFSNLYSITWKQWSKKKISVRTTMKTWRNLNKGDNARAKCSCLPVDQCQKHIQSSWLSPLAEPYLSCCSSFASLDYSSSSVTKITRNISKLKHHSMSTQQ